MGWISPGALDYVCGGSTCRRPRPTASPTSTRCSRSHRGRRWSRTSATTSPAGSRGAEALCAEARARRSARRATSRDGRVTWLRSPCLGLCERAPAALLIAAGEPPPTRSLGAGRRGAAVRAAVAGRAVRAAGSRRAPCRKPAARRSGCSRRVGRVDPASLDAYRANGGYAGPAPGDRDGPGRRDPRGHRGRSWWAAAARPSRPGASGRPCALAAARPHYFVCNADESEPGTFKDRVLMEGDPFAVLEAMTIAGFATGCETGLPLHARRVSAGAPSASPHAIARARAARLPRRQHPGRRRSLRRRAAPRRRAPTSAARRRRCSTRIEGCRGEPRNKPPFPVEARPVRPADGRQQRRDAGQYPRRSSCSGGAGLCGDRAPSVDRPQAVLRLRARGAPGRLRGRPSASPCGS